jgi:prepilin-type N-terminal cleavage/methylation domain-containing protein
MLAPTKTKGGYTLLEMMIVVAIVGVLCAISVPNFIIWNQKQKLKSDVANLAGTLAIARMTAINQNTPVVVSITQIPPAAVSVTFLSPVGAVMLPPITMSPIIRLTDAVGGAALSPQDLRFNNMGTWVNTGTLNNICIPGACPSTSQVLNFRNGGTDNFRIVVLQTGKIIWCYIPTCIQ